MYKVLGMHEGGFTPFSFRVDDLLNFDRSNTLILRVVGPILCRTKESTAWGRWKHRNGAVQSLAESAAGSSGCDGATFM